MALLRRANAQRDLVRRPQFIDPFIKACTTQNARFAGAAVVCLQRLIVMSAVPRSRLSEVLDGFKDSSQLSNFQTPVTIKSQRILTCSRFGYPVEDSPSTAFFAPKLL